MTISIREADPYRDPDAAAIRRLFTTLHEHERAIDPRMRPSAEIVDGYLARSAERCREYDGVVLVAERAGGVAGDAAGVADVAGYVCVWRRYVSDELDDPPGEMGYVSDLVVAEDARGLGVGRALLRAAEDAVRAAGVATLRLSVLAGNEGALALYEAEGFVPVELDLEKAL